MRSLIAAAVLAFAIGIAGCGGKTKTSSTETAPKHGYPSDPGKY
jgi:hypothetical protein